MWLAFAPSVVDRVELAAPARWSTGIIRAAS